MDKPVLLQLSEEIQEFNKALTEMRIMLHGAVASSEGMRIEIPAQVLRDINEGKYFFNVMNKPDSLVLTAEKESVIEVVK